LEDDPPEKNHQATDKAECNNSKCKEDQSKLPTDFREDNVLGDLFHSDEDICRATEEKAQAACSVESPQRDLLEPFPFEDSYEDNQAFLPVDSTEWKEDLSLVSDSHECPTMNKPT